MNRMFGALTRAVPLTAPAAGHAFAAATPSGTGRPSQMGYSATPLTTPGSVLHPTGGASGTQPQNANNPKNISQYGVACYQVSH